MIPQLFAPPANDEEKAGALDLQLANMSATGKLLWPVPDKGLKKRLDGFRASSPTHYDLRLGSTANFSYSAAAAVPMRASA